MKTLVRLYALLLAGLLPACDHPAGYGAGKTGEFTAADSGGAPQRGAKLIVKYGCSACHTVPGILRARGRVGPPLDFFSERAYIGGELPNTPETLVHWIMDAPGLIPGTAMPRLGVNERDARDIAAYLYSLD